MLHRALFLLAFLASQNPTPPPTVTLEGRVVDLRGEGVPAAQLQVVTWQQRDVVLAKGMCDGDGFFRIGRVPPRPSWLVEARSTGSCNGEAQVSGEPSPVRIQLQDAATVRGVLRDRAGKPVPGALVRATLTARILYSAHSDARTGDDGAFVLADVPLGLIRFAAVVPGEGVAELSQLVTGETQVEVAVGAEPTTSLQVTVTGMPAAAIATLTASILPYGKGRLTRLPPPWDRPCFDPDGRFTLPHVPDLEYHVSPRAEGHVFAPREIKVKAGTGPHRLQFTAAEVGSTALQCPARLCDGEGKPLAGVRLALRASNSSLRAEAASGEDGALVFDSPLAKGDKAIVYSLDPRWVLDQQKVEGMSGQWDRRFLIDHECTVDPAVTLQLSALPACSVRGTVSLADGRPAAFVEVELEESSANRMPQWMTFAWATTDRDGHYAFTARHHIQDPVRVKVEGVLGAAASEPFAFDKPGMAVKVAELQLSAPATVEGTVLDAQQRPAPGVRVWLRDWDFGKSAQKSGSVVEVITDRLGRYRFVGVPPGGAWLQLTAAEDFPRERAVEPFEVEAGKSYTEVLQLPAK